MIVVDREAQWAAHSATYTSLFMTYTIHCSQYHVCARKRELSAMFSETDMPRIYLVIKVKVRQVTNKFFLLDKTWPIIQLMEQVKVTSYLFHMFVVKGEYG